MARAAWLYDKGSLSELSDLPTAMRGMTALGACGTSCAMGGGLGQIWQFKNGAFDSTQQTVDRGDLFQGRVRDLWRWVLRASPPSP